jgi:hypothetical protein
MSFHDKTSVACPICSHRAEISRSIFRSDFQCQHCRAPLQVSQVYWRVLGLLSVLAGYVLAWEIGIRGPRLCGIIPWGFLLLWAPIGFIVLMLLVRIAPFVVKPTLIPRRPFESHVTTLNLTPGPKDDTRI